MARPVIVVARTRFRDRMDMGNISDALPGRPTVVLADDYPGLVVAFQRLLEPSCSVIGTAVTGRQAIERTTTLQPDVVVLDLTMPDLDGLEVCRAIKRAVPATDVIVVTAVDDLDVRRAAMQVGASAFVLKHTAAVDLEQTVQRLYKERQSRRSS